MAAAAVGVLATAVAGWVKLRKQNMIISLDRDGGKVEARIQARYQDRKLVTGLIEQLGAIPVPNESPEEGSTKSDHTNEDPPPPTAS